MQNMQLQNGIHSVSLTASLIILILIIELILQAQAINLSAHICCDQEKDDGKLSLNIHIFQAHRIKI